MNESLGQYYYCPNCDDFFRENAIACNIETYLSATIKNNIANCQNGHLRKVDKEYMVFLSNKPEKHFDSTVLCFDIQSFTEKEEAVQFNILSIIQTACIDISSKQFQSGIFKGTGDGFLLGLPSFGVDKAITFVNFLHTKYISSLPHISYRIGISYGTYFSYKGLNTSEDIFGKEVNNACRIADFGNKNTILLSSKAKDNLIQNKDYIKHIEDIGNCIDKHRIPHKVYNYRDEIIGASFY